jgi:hypothetical protein
MNQLATTATAEAARQVVDLSHATPLDMPPALPTGGAIASITTLMLDERALDRLERVANMMASGKSTIPQHLVGNVGDCFAVCMQAFQWGMNPFAVAQKTHLVNGTLGYEAQLVIAVLNSSPALATRIDFRWSDDATWKGVNGKSDTSPDRWVEVWAQLKGEAKPRTLKVTMAQVGTVRNSPNWAADPRQQLGYLCAKRWGRLNAPDVILGVYTPDELEDGLGAGIGGGGQPAGQGALPRNASGAQVAAAAAAQPQATDKVKSMIADLEIVAVEDGELAFKRAWMRLPEPDREAIGIAERDQLLAMGRRTDEQRKRKESKNTATDATPANVTAAAADEGAQQTLDGGQA